MLRLRGRRRQALGATLRELANYGAVALVFRQFVGDRGASWQLMLVGVVFWVASVATALAIEDE